MRFVWFAALSLAGCAMNGSTPVPAAAGTMWGTDAHLAPSRPDAVLRYADHPRGLAELRLPAGKGPFPLAVIFHGGCFKTGIADHGYMGPLATRWQQHGIASLNIDYREVGDGGGWPGSFVDWQDAARLIDKVARDYPVDRSRVTLVGHSAGALPALWLASAQESGAPAGRRAAVRARAAIVLDGPGDLGREAAAFDALCQFSSVDPFVGGLPARLERLGPRPELTDVLFVQAKLPAPPEASLAAVQAGGAEAVVRENPGASHFAIITPGEPAYSANEAAMLRVLRAANGV